MFFMYLSPGKGILIAGALPKPLIQEKKLLNTPGVINHSHPKILQSHWRVSTPAGRKRVPTKALLSL